MLLIVIDQADKAKELLKTNKEVNVGDKLKGPDKTKMQALAAANPEVFKLEMEEKDMQKKPAYKPESNKLLKQDSNTKTKKTAKKTTKKSSK
jgi:hypothetical protein